MKSKKIHNENIDRKLSRILTVLQLKTLCCDEDTIKLIIDSATAQNLIKNNTFPMIDLRELHPCIDTSNLHSVQYPDFAMHKRNNFIREQLTSSPMRIMLLGKENANVFS